MSPWGCNWCCHSSHGFIPSFGFRIHRGFPGSSLIFLASSSSLLLYFPNAPWCWNIYLHLPQKWYSFVGKYTIHRALMGLFMVPCRMLYVLASFVERWFPVEPGIRKKCAVVRSFSLQRWRWSAGSNIGNDASWVCHGLSENSNWFIMAYHGLSWQNSALSQFHWFIMVNKIIPHGHGHRYHRLGSSRFQTQLKFTSNGFSTGLSHLRTQRRHS